MPEFTSDEIAVLREFDRDYFEYVHEIEKESRKGKPRLKSLFSANKASAVEIATKLFQSKRPYFELMMAYKYKPPTQDDISRVDDLNTKDMFWPLDLYGLSVAIEAVLFAELREFYEYEFKDKLIKTNHHLTKTFLTILAKKILGKSLRTMFPGSVVGERALEEKQRTSRTASVISLDFSM